MQIDFHHAVTYVVARLAGFNHKKADIIAYCAQYVDDATNAGLIHFNNGALYNRISSAHRMLDHRNLEELANHQVWIPFHFLPGNGGQPAGKNPEGTFIDKLICRPNSPIAQDMVRACIEQQGTAYGLHRLGITMHVFADTWAHQGFAGVNHEVNSAENILNPNGKPAKKLMDRVASYFIGEALPLGHGAVLSFPDRPFLKWSYTDGRDKKISRDNPADFLQAADEMCKVMQRFLLKDADAETDGLPEKDKVKLASMLRNTKGEEGDIRHEKWLQAIQDGKFSFGPVELSYIPKGKSSWKHTALGTTNWVDREKDVHRYKKSFLKSNWKFFHDALQAHRFVVLHDILPRYGICAA